ncbi:ThiF family adenylyltransferase [Epilithonimonas sp. JDS]|uniref:ThiF family adenylyltransferase n=1 Tax=Epilithonimonas sp. JDS TaxID=2902797 RepID=UPI001E486C3E|nr:ThiF family adenylyltransferase [Epilithonimonas sp. JDS]MCD9853838.1 ThiF family adenylyltransferase [Epilithonimonas sp. JDS]
MLLQQLSHSPDIRSLINDGYELEIKGGYISIHHIPYVNFNKEIKYGTLFSPFQMIPSTNTVAKPNDHVVYFVGEKPCYADGTPIKSIELQERQVLSNDFIADFSFSSRPQIPFENFHEKFKSYIRIISNEAISLDETGTVTAKTSRPIVITEAEIPFKYFDSNSSRAKIDFLNEKFLDMKIAIVGLGGTGSYILDLVSKTCVSEIHLYDDDVFESHNAFRTPGAASISDLDNRQKKVDYLFNIYSKMHSGLIPHSEIISDLNIFKLEAMDFVFVCIDRNNVRNFITEYLLSKNVDFIDVGLGIEVMGEKLIGATRISYKQQVGSDNIEIEDNPYSSNIQIAELNALNAVQAVIKWKQHCGFYDGLKNQQSSHFILSNSKIFHDEIPA